MKSFFNVILVIIVAGLIYLIISAIMDPINFNRAKNVRDFKVEQSLINIKKAQIEYSKQHGGEYCSNWSELANFLKRGKLPAIRCKDDKCDTTWVSILDSIFPKGFNADSMKYVPFGRGIIFELSTRTDTTQRGYKNYLFQAQTPYQVYLRGLDNHELTELINIQTKLKKYSGLKIGDIEQPNNNAGNWE